MIFGSAARLALDRARDFFNCLSSARTFLLGDLINARQIDSLTILTRIEIVTSYLARPTALARLCDLVQDLTWFLWFDGHVDTPSI